MNILTCIAAATFGPLVDVIVFCALIGTGLPVQSSHIASFSVALALNYMFKVRRLIIAEKRTQDWRLYSQLAVVNLLALFLRGGVLGIVLLEWGYSAPLAIACAVIASSTVTTAGYSWVFSAQNAARTRNLAIGLIGYAFLLRLVYLGAVNLLPEETYYWNYSRHLDTGYLDHPPMVAWLIRLGTALFGQTQFGVRIGALCCAAITALYTYRLTRHLFGAASARAALILSQTLPFFFLSGMLITPDAPLAAAWAASLYFLERALLAGQAKAWLAAGLALGIGAISKYSIGLLVPVILAFMIIDHRSRFWWRRWEPYLAALIAITIFSPVFIWNAHHEWISFVFQTSRRVAEAPKFALHKLIASALVLITPIGVLAVATSFASTHSIKTDDHVDAPRQRLFIYLALLFPLSVFVIFSLRHEVKLDWTGALWVAALPLMAASMSGAVGGGAYIHARLRAAWLPTIVTMLLTYAAGLHYLVLGLPGVGYSKHIELIPVGWHDLSRRILLTTAAVRTATGVQPLIVGMDRYAIASELAFYGFAQMNMETQTSSAHLFDGIGLMYERWTPAELQQGRTLLLIAWDPMDLTGKTIESHVERLGPIEHEVLIRDERVIRQYYYRLAYNYHSVPPLLH